MRQAALGATVLLTLSPGPAVAADHTVRKDGTGRFTTIQACANAATAGDSCLVSAGTYDEVVQTVWAGANEANRIVFKAQGTVTIKGFDIKHAYVTVDGFSITGRTTGYAGYINVDPGGHSCQILNNRIYDPVDHTDYNGEPRLLGMRFATSGGQAANNCVVRGNTISNLIYIFISTRGSGHLFENNTLEYTNSWDYVYPFGTNITFRRNIFRHGTVSRSAGNHFDFAQAFGDGYPGPSNNILFEENWIQDVEGAFSQLSSSDIKSGTLYDTIGNWTFRRNVVVNVLGNGTLQMPGIRLENNTFYRLAYAQNGLGFGGSFTRGDFHNSVIKNNVLLAGGSSPAVANGEGGFYSVGLGFRLNREVIGVRVTNDSSVLGDNPGNATTQGIAASLVANGYLLSLDGGIGAPAKALTSISQFALDPQYDAYKTAMYNTLVAAATKDTNARASFAADYNYVAGSAEAGYPAKKSSGCVPGQTATLYNFCEAHGINGGNPRLRDLSNPLGPDGLPFTLDDGLKPLPDSPLCGRGEGGTDIGAYSCDPSKVFPDSVAAPRPPTSLRVVP